MELTREYLETLSKMNGGGCFSWEDVKLLATSLLSELDKPKVWDGAPDNAGFASVNFCKESGLPLQFGKTMFYTRTLPKSPVREIAERRSKVIVSTQMTERELIADQIEAAINEYKEREK